MTSEGRHFALSNPDEPKAVCKYGQSLSSLTLKGQHTRELRFFYVAQDMLFAISDTRGKEVQIRAAEHT